MTLVEGSGAAQRLVDYDLTIADEAVRIETPVSIQALRQENLPLAVDWRIKTREIFETYFGRGYVAVDFDREEREGAQHNVYTLWHPPVGWLAAFTA